MNRLDQLQEAAALDPLLPKLAHVIAVPVASVGAIAPHIQEHLSLAKEIMSAPASTYASILSCIYLTLMIIKTLRELYLTFKKGKKNRP